MPSKTALHPVIPLSALGTELNGREEKSDDRATGTEAVMGSGIVRGKLSKCLHNGLKQGDQGEAVDPSLTDSNPVEPVEAMTKGESLARCYARPEAQGPPAQLDVLPTRSTSPHHTHGSPANNNHSHPISPSRPNITISTSHNAPPPNNTDNIHTTHTNHNIQSSKPKPGSSMNKLIEAIRAKPTLSRTWEKQTFVDELRSAPLRPLNENGDGRPRSMQRPTSLYASPSAIRSFRPLPQTAPASRENFM